MYKRTLKKIILSLILLHVSFNISWAKLPQTIIAIGPIQATVEVADNDKTRSYGLMNREHLATDHGMLFVFDHQDRHCFWMKNTLIPLSIAFIDANNVIIDIQDMQPKSQAIHCPKNEVKQALEMNQGWFKKNRITTGMRIISK